MTVAKGVALVSDRDANRHPFGRRPAAETGPVGKALATFPVWDACSSSVTFAVGNSSLQVTHQQGPIQWTTTPLPLRLLARHRQIAAARALLEARLTSDLPYKPPLTRADDFFASGFDFAQIGTAE